MSEANNLEPARDAPVARAPRSAYLLALVVLLGSLLVVGLYWRSAHEREMRASQADFVASTEESAALLYQRLGNYELVARGGVSLFASVARPSRRQWKDYVDALNMGAQFPELVGLGFAIHASPGQLADLQQLMRDGGEGLFSIHPRGPRPQYGAVLYLEPRSAANIAAIGYDMYAEPVRHAAMEASLVAGEARLSGVIHLVQDNGSPIAAVELFLPVYRAGDVPRNVAARRESMQGWVYAPFRLEEFVAMALRARPHRSWLRIVDVSGPTERTLYSDLRAPDAAPAAFVHSAVIERYGRRWRLDFESGPAASVQSHITGLNNTIAVGVFASLLLFAIALTLALTQARAERLAARMSESYRRSEQRFRSAMEYSAIGKALLDRDGRIIEVNPAMGALMGVASGALVGRDFESLFADERAAVGRERDTVVGVHRTTRMLRQNDGGIRQAQLTFAPVPSNVSQDIARLVQIEDVTDRLRAEAEVLALNRTLEARVEARTRELLRANQDLESFAYSISHDLRAPLRAIDGFSRLLSDRYADRIDDDGRAYLARVCNAAGRMGTLIESLLKMARLGRGGVRRCDVDLSRLASEIAADLRESDPAREVEFAVAPGLHVDGDPALLRALLQNLMGNAWKFSADSDHARIEFGVADDGFFVRDNGVGFAQEYAAKLFRPFQRLHAQEQFAGDGIGLASVKRIVELHGGSIRAEGRPGEGATFWFNLPQPDSGLGAEPLAS